MSTAVSILLPTYEPHADHLRAAIDSVLAQTTQDWSLLIHDDASQTDVRAIVEPYLADPRISFERSNRRLGIGGNWNACLRKADAPLVQFLFQDDVWDSAYLERAMRVMEEHPDVGIVSVHHRYAFEGDSSTRTLYDELQSVKAAHLHEGRREGMELLRWWMDRGLSPNIIGEPSFVMLRKSVTDQIGFFDERMPQFLDSEYWTECLAVTNWYFLSEELGTFRVHGDAASARNFRAGRGILDRLRTMKRAVGLLPQEHQEHAKTIIREQTNAMARKFFERFGPVGTQFTENEAPHVFAIKHPIVTTKTMVNYLRGTR